MIFYINHFSLIIYLSFSLVGLIFCLGGCVLRECVVEGGGLDWYFGEQGLPAGIQECLERFHRRCVDYLSRQFVPKWDRCFTDFKAFFCLTVLYYGKLALAVLFKYRRNLPRWVRGNIKIDGVWLWAFIYGFMRTVRREEKQLSISINTTSVKWIAFLFLELNCFPINQTASHKLPCWKFHTMGCPLKSPNQC